MACADLHFSPAIRKTAGWGGADDNAPKHITLTLPLAGPWMRRSHDLHTYIHAYIHTCAAYDIPELQWTALSPAATLLRCKRREGCFPANSLCSHIL